MTEAGKNQSKLSQYLRQRKLFARNTIVLAIVFILLTFLQWLALVLIDTVDDFFNKNHWISLAFLICTLIVILIFIFVGAIRFHKPWNIIVAIVIMELLVLGLAVIFTKLRTGHLTPILISLCITLLLFVIFHCLALNISRDLTLDIVVIFVCTLVFFTTSYFFLLIALYQGTFYGLAAFNLLLMAMLALFIMYHSQTIHGGRYAEVRLKDHVLASLIMYFDFIILYLLVNMQYRTVSRIVYGFTHKKHYGYNTTMGYDASTTPHIDLIL